MNIKFKDLVFLTVLALCATACTAQAVRAEPAEVSPAAVNYEAVLGLSLHDQRVADFIDRNSCNSSGSFELCQNAGVAFWADSNQIVKTIYLYPRAADGFMAYQGDLPFSLTADDTMASVEQKFGQPKVEFAPQVGWEAGLPDEGGSPDHVHYWAIYKRFGVTIVYNTPSLSDKNAIIYEIIVDD